MLAMLFFGLVILPIAIWFVGNAVFGDYGGAGYGKHSRPDLSNTSFLIDALRAVGNEADSIRDSLRELRNEKQA